MTNKITEDNMYEVIENIIYKHSKEEVVKCVQSLITSVKQEERERIGNKMNKLEYIWETDAMVCFKEKIIYPLKKLDILARCPNCKEVCMTPLMYLKYQIQSLTEEGIKS